MEITGLSQHKNSSGLLPLHMTIGWKEPTEGACELDGHNGSGWRVATEKSGRLVSRRTHVMSDSLATVGVPSSRNSLV
ncbi:hypothetical protein ElyMa_005186200 [Elysia marginata]|uniref:MAM domain-containing protein n=1 Tax=Elysia marginata TaxID=1093978 RepID=A0AAV4JT71_9GAST|nr:hypothetical protein ElyMa_005186200 [Elysia marginata]